MAIIVVILIILVFLGLCTVNLGLGLAIIVFVGLLCAFIFQNSNEKEKKIKEIREKGSQKIKQELEAQSFKSSKEFYLGHSSLSPKMKIDMAGKKIAICDYTDGSLKIIPFQNIVDCEIVEDNDTVLSGGIGRAIVGGAIAGEMGAIIGAATRKSKSIVRSLLIKIGTSSVNEPLVVIPLISDPLKRESTQYKELWKTAQEIYATLVSIIKTTTEPDLNNFKGTVSNKGTVSKIKMLEELKNSGILTEEEYKRKKEDLLKKI